MTIICPHLSRHSRAKAAPARPRQQLYSDGKPAEILAAVDGCLPKDGEGNFIADQEKSDVVHDLLAFLAERMLEMNRQKLAIDPVRQKPAELLRSEFEGSLGKLLPLLERIERTDRLIDAVVYRLYGLTEEEIGIVEGKAN